VFVSGASGFIGSKLAKRLAAEDAQVSVLIRDSIKAKSLRDNNIRVFYGDIVYSELLAPAMEGCQLVFHCAAAGGGSLEESRATNVEGTRNILECAKQAGVKRIVHVSSIAVYGYNLPLVVDESQPYASKGNSYTLSKAEGEQLALRLGKEQGVEVVVVQPTYVYGPGSPIWTMRFFQKVKDEQIVLVDNGAGFCNPVYIDDLVDALLLSAEYDAAAGERFIISGQTPVTWREYLGCLASMCNKPTPPVLPLWKARMQFQVLLWHFRFTRQPMKFDWSDVQLMCNHTVFSIDKARNVLGYQPKVNLDEGMAHTATWLRGQGYLVSRSDC
jgi:nucleoside-diphosphate-sugar epimerase